MSEFESARGNLLKGDDTIDALVNAVNCVGVMSKGIALDFKKAFPDCFKLYKIACKKGWVRPGRVHVYECPPAICGPQLIFNFPTKRHWKDNSLMEDIDSGLVDLVRLIKKMKVRSIAIPPLGCGNGGLDWREVRPKIVEALKDIPNLRVVLYDPPGFKPAPTPAPEGATKRARSPGREGFCAPF